jgi:hypothetical protein
MIVLAVPNREFPPDEDALALAGDVLDSLQALTPDRVRAAAEGADSQRSPPTA